MGIRVWIIDDNRDGRMMLKKLLEMSGAEVTDFKSANEALERLDRSTPEVWYRI
jgi:CheY-like chemotaxis protein